MFVTFKIVDDVTLIGHVQGVQMFSIQVNMLLESRVLICL